MKKYGSIVLNVILIIFGLCGQHFTISGIENFMQSDAYCYYTNQSNLLVIAVAVISLIFEIRKINGKDIPKAISLLRLVSTAAITLTFLVFSILLTPVMIKDGSGAYLLSPGNLFVHNLVPIMAIIDWCIYGNSKQIEKSEVFYCAIPPTAYTAFVYIRAAMGLTIGGETAPYFFMNYEKLGWLTVRNGSIGVVYWLIILLVSVVLMGFGFWKAAKRHK